MKENYYILGFLWADGYLCGRNPSVRLEIKQDDGDNIKDLLSEWTLYKNPPKKENWSPTYVFSRGKNYANFLEDLDYKKKESCIKVLSTIPTEDRYMWWRGYSDGDGGFYTGGNSIRQWTLSGPFDSNWSPVIGLLQEIGIKNIREKRYISPKGHKSSSIDIRGLESLIKLGSYLYPQGWDGIGLKRKYDKLQECLISYKWGERCGKRKKNDLSNG